MKIVIMIREIIIMAIITETTTIIMVAIIRE